MSESWTDVMPVRAEYGSGVFVRSLAICSPAAGQVRLAMEDPVHAFQIDFSHREGRVEAIAGRWIRSPLSTCGGAPDALAQAMVSCALRDSLFDIARHTDAASQCTHMYDMFCLAATHAHAARADARYDVTVPDAPGGVRHATLTCNGEILLELTIDDTDVIVAPEPCRGISVMEGFMSWVRANVPAHRHEHYFIMQRALFVARSQWIDLESMIGQHAKRSGPPDGTCFGSQQPEYESALRVGVVRRFDRETMKDVLSFFEPRQT